MDLEGLKRIIGEKAHQLMSRGAEGQRERIIYAKGGEAKAYAVGGFHYAGVKDKPPGTGYTVVHTHPHLKPETIGKRHYDDSFSVTDITGFLRDKGQKRAAVYTRAGNVHVMEKTPQTAKAVAREHDLRGAVQLSRRSYSEGDRDMGQVASRFKMKYYSFGWR